VVSPILSEQDSETKKIVRNGGLLLCLLKTDDSLLAPPPGNPSLSGNPPPIIESEPELEFVDFEDKPFPEFYPNPDPHIEPAKDNQDETTEEEEIEQYHQPRSTLPNPPRDSVLGLEMDWDSSENFERRLMRTRMTRRSANDGSR